MNTKTNIVLPVIFSGLLALSAFPAHAVTFNSSWFANKTGVGTIGTNMTPSATTFCFLSRVNVEEVRLNNNFAECVVTRGPAVWRLNAIVGAGAPAEARCRAYCYNN